MNIPNMLKAKIRTKDKTNIYNYNLENKYKNLGKNKKYFLRTYGCQMNERDSEIIKGLLESVGYKETSKMDEANLILFNTCAIRENAHNKVFGLLGKAKYIKNRKEDVLVGICGCMSQEQSVVETILDKYKYVDFVIGTHEIQRLIPFIYERVNNNTKIVEAESKEGDVWECLPSTRESKITAYVNIILGCDKFCTYCIVPYTRGKQRSRTHESIVEEVNNLIKEGYKEVTLLGQNVNAYGKDLYEDYNLSNLLGDVSKTGIERIRFVTSHPWDFTDEMLEVISKYKNIMPYIHLPIQSGSNRILKLMGRRYTKEEYLTLYNKIREKIENVSITTDIIVGFPGETEEDFNDTLDIVETCKFDGAFTFIYSPRESTPAALMKEQITEEVKKDRLKKLNKRVNYYSNLSNKELLDKKVKCLVLGVSEKDDTKVMGYTENMKLVNIEGDKSLIGNVCEVLITDAKSFSLDGKAIK